MNENPEQLDTPDALEDTPSEGRPFLAAEHNLFGYDRVVVKGGKIIILKSSNGEKPDLRLRMEVILEGDSRGYVPSGHKSGDCVRIIRFAEPFIDDVSDHIIYVTGGSLSGWVKPSNINTDKYSPTDVLKYMAQMGQDLTRYAQQAEAMLAEAEEKGIPVDLSANEALQKFKPKGEHEVQLVKLRSELMSIGSDLFSQGVKMTQEDLRERLEKMGL